MIGAGGCKQQGFGLGGPFSAGRAQQQIADCLGTRSAPGFPGGDNRQPKRPQRFGQQLCLGGLARPFPALERDKSTARDAHAKSPAMALTIRTKGPAGLHRFCRKQGNARRSHARRRDFKGTATSLSNPRSARA